MSEIKFYDNGNYYKATFTPITSVYVTPQATLPTIEFSNNADNIQIKVGDFQLKENASNVPGLKIKHTSNPSIYNTFFNDTSNKIKTITNIIQFSTAEQVEPFLWNKFSGTFESNNDVLIADQNLKDAVTVNKDLYYYAFGDTDDTTVSSNKFKFSNNGKTIPNSVLAKSNGKYLYFGFLREFDKTYFLFHIIYAFSITMEKISSFTDPFIKYIDAGKVYYVLELDASGQKTNNSKAMRCGGFTVTRIEENGIEKFKLKLTDTVQEWICKYYTLIKFGENTQCTFGTINNNTRGRIKFVKDFDFCSSNIVKDNYLLIISNYSQSISKYYLRFAANNFLPMGKVNSTALRYTKLFEQYTGTTKPYINDGYIAQYFYYRIFSINTFMNLSDSSWCSLKSIYDNNSKYNVGDNALTNYIEINFPNNENQTKYGYTMKIDEYDQMLNAAKPVYYGGIVTLTFSYNQNGLSQRAYKSITITKENRSKGAFTHNIAINQNTRATKSVNLSGSSYKNFYIQPIVIYTTQTIDNTGKSTYKSGNIFEIENIFENTIIKS